MNNLHSGEVFSPHNRFERVNLPTGQLSLVAAVRRDLPSGFTTDLIKAAPWSHLEKGEWLKEQQNRRVQLYDINGYPLVLKEMQMSGVEVAGETGRKKASYKALYHLPR